MQVGDLVRFPGSEPQGQALGSTLGIIVGIDPHHRSEVKPSLRVNVWWFVDQEASWEPPKWLEVVNERE